MTELAGTQTGLKKDLKDYDGLSDNSDHHSAPDMELNNVPKPVNDDFSHGSSRTEYEDRLCEENSCASLSSSTVLTPESLRGDNTVTNNCRSDDENDDSLELNNNRCEVLTTSRCDVLTEPDDVNEMSDHHSESKENMLQFDNNATKRRLEKEKSRTLSHSNHLNGGISKPGIILLGRGNSFSLGRSEVILLHHHRPKSLKDRKSKRSGVDFSKGGKTIMNLENNNNSRNSDDEKSFPLQTISERRLSVENDGVKLNITTDRSDSVDNKDNRFRVPSPSPPHVSNGSCHISQNAALDLNETSESDDDENEESVSNSSSSHVLELVPSYEDDLKDLWMKTESVMASRNERVRSILEEFGIGEPGGGGGEDVDVWEDDEEVLERKKEEEDVWQIIQDSFRV